MKINEGLIYTGDNFNIVFEEGCDIMKAAEIIRATIVNSDVAESVSELQIDAQNNKIYISEGTIGNYNTVVSDICKALAAAFPNNCFYGHAYYDDFQCGYESCADYQFENGKLHLELFESENGNGFCPECGEQLVCFDEFDASQTYHCDDCEIDVSAEDMFDSTLPVKQVIDL